MNGDGKGAGGAAPWYEARGASATKPEIKQALAGIEPGLFPGAFCKAVPDHLAGSPEHCVLTHADGAGTKSALAYLHYRRHGDANVFRGIAQDAIVMNLDDLLCVGCTGPFVLSNTIGRNSKRIPGEVLTAIIAGYEEFAATMRPYGVEIVSCGGETADVGDLVRSIIVDATLAARMRRDAFINCAGARPGHVIVGLASSGRCAWETKPNSGIGTNGFTALRHGLFASDRAEFAETFAPEIAELAYTGPYGIDDPLPGTGMTLAEACLAPTRTYAPVMLPILARYRSQISAVFHNTGGGQTKCLNFGADVRYVKDRLFPAPPLFAFIRETTGLPLAEMLTVFNMGHRLEILCEEEVAQPIIALCASFDLEAQIVGHVEKAAGRSLSIAMPEGSVEFAG